jgi:hypothetical protein
MTDFRPDIVARIIELISGEIAVGGPRKKPTIREHAS